MSYSTCKNYTKSVKIIHHPTDKIYIPNCIIVNSRSMLNHYQVIVVGGGPGGLSAGMHLNHQNINHLVIEKDSFPRDKICGDAVSMRGLGHLHKLYPIQIEEFLK